MSRETRSAKEKILESAELVFGEMGFKKTRLEDIASAAGMRRPSLLHHFASKTLLYSEVVERAFEELSAVLVNAIAMSAGLGLQEILQRITGDLIGFSLDRPAVLSLVFRELLNPVETGSSVLEKGLEPLLDRLEELIELSSGNELPRDFPVRDAIVSLFLVEMARAAVSPAAHKVLWKGKPSRTPDLVSIIFKDNSSVK